MAERLLGWMLRLQCGGGGVGGAGEGGWGSVCEGGGGWGCGGWGGCETFLHFVPFPLFPLTYGGCDFTRKWHLASCQVPMYFQRRKEMLQLWVLETHLLPAVAGGRCKS